MKNFEGKIKSKMITMPRLMQKSIKIVMCKFLRRGLRLMSIPESRVNPSIRNQELGFGPLPT